MHPEITPATQQLLEHRPVELREQAKLGRRRKLTVKAKWRHGAVLLQMWSQDPQPPRYLGAC